MAKGTIREVVEVTFAAGNKTQDVTVANAVATDLCYLTASEAIPNFIPFGQYGFSAVAGVGKVTITSNLTDIPSAVKLNLLVVTTV